MKIKVKIEDNVDVIDFESYNEIWDRKKWIHLVDEDRYDDWYPILTSISIDGRKVDLAELDAYDIFCKIYTEKLVKLAKEILEEYDTDEGISRHGFLPNPDYSKKLKEFVQNPDCEECIAFEGRELGRARVMHEIALIERDRELAANIERVWKEICNGTNIIIEFEIACL